MDKESNIDEVRKELAWLKREHRALLKSHRNLVLKVLGDSSEAENFLNEINKEVIESLPQWLK